MSITSKIRELQSQPASTLATSYEALFGRPPRTKNRAWLFRQVAWKLLEREFGGLSDRARTRLDELVAQIDLPLRDATPPRPRPTPKPHAAPNTPMVGTTLVREWRGQQLRVEVRADGFEWNSVVYKSLSACAKAITGAGWSGALFFGLRRRTGA